MDISLSQLDQPATPLLTGHGHSRAPVGLEDEEPLQRPSLPRIDGIFFPFEYFVISLLIKRPTNLDLLCIFHIFGYEFIFIWLLVLTALFSRIPLSLSRF